MLKISISVLIVTVFYCSYGQEFSAPPKSQEILNAFLEKIGGAKRWDSLTTRIEYSYVTRHDGSENRPINNSYAQTNYFKYPNFNVQKKESFLKGMSLLVYTPKCSWFYSEVLSSILFFDYGQVKPSDRFPKSEFWRALNHKPQGKADQDDLHFIIKMKDKSKKDGVQRLYFDKETFLLKRTTLLDNNGILYTYSYDRYVQKEGFLEPYRIVLDGNGDPFLTIAIDKIEYDDKIDPKIFDSPIPCGKSETHVVVDDSLLVNY